MKIQIGNNITFNIKNNQIDDVKSVSCVLRYSAIPNNSSLYTLNNCNSEYYNALPQNLSVQERPALKDGDVITLNSEYDDDTKTISCIFPKEDLTHVGSYQLVVVLYCEDLNYKYVYEDTLQLYAKYTEFNEDVVINIVGTFSKIETVISSLQDLVDILFDEETGVIYELKREKLAISDYNIVLVSESQLYDDTYSSNNIIYLDAAYPATWIPNNGTWNETKGSLFSHEGEWRVITENYPDDLLFTATFGDLWEFFYLNSKPLGIGEDSIARQLIVNVEHEITQANNEIELINLNLETVVTPTLASLLPKIVEITKSGSTYTTTADYNDVLEHVLKGGHAMFKYDGSKDWDDTYCVPISFVEMSVAGIGINGLCGQVYISPTAGRIAHVSIFWSSSGTLTITKA